MSEKERGIVRTKFQIIRFFRCVVRTLFKSKKINKILNRENNMGEKEKSFLELEKKLSEIKNPIIQSMTRNLLYRSLSPELQLIIREQSQKLITNSKNKYNCLYPECCNKAILSHNLSKSRIESICNFTKKCNDKLYIQLLKPNLKTGQAEYEFMDITTKVANTFVGYCSQHDKIFFQDLDSISDSDDYMSIQKQFIRAIAYKIHNLRTLQSSYDSNERKISIQKEINFFKKSHDKLIGLTNKNNKTYIKKYLIKETFFLCSIAIQIDDNTLIFLNIQNIQNQYYLYVGFLGLPEEFEKFFDEIESFEGRLFIAELLLHHKNEIIFSPNFELAELNDILNSIIPINKYGRIEQYYLANRIFNDLTI